MGQLEGKVAIVTGAASGIGEASARLFVAEGARVLLADIQDEKGKGIAAELGDAAAYLHTDVCREESVRAMIDEAIARFGRLDVLFNNAGAPGPGGPIAGTSVDGFDQTIALLLRSVFLGIKYAAGPMTAQGAGSIISTASVAGLQAGFGPHVYSAAKAAVIQLTRTVAMEFGEQGVRVNAICPGGIATPIFGKAHGLSNEQADRTVDAVRRVMLPTMQPIRRAGLPDDIAQAALWLASDAAGFVNGHALVVDGGLTGGRQWSVVKEQRDRMMTAFGISS
ncbi:MAG: glucose 1-dehydrogenase [Burkholderiaceae bacterium]